MDDKSDLGLRFECPALLPDNGVIFELSEAGAAEGTALTAQGRRDALARLRAGEVVELDLAIRPYSQTKTARPLTKKQAKEANANFLHFKPSEMGRVARSFKSRPFLRDHDRNDLLARGGTIQKSEAIETADRVVMSQSVRLVKPWAVEAALDGTLDAFSIGWDPPGHSFKARRDSINCTVCGCSMFSSDCPHLPGDEAKVDGSDETFIVEAEFKGAKGAEVSAVTFPAVQGTKVDSIRQALTEAREQRKLAPPARKARSMNPATLKRLGLSEDATPEQVDAAIEKLAETSETEALRIKLEAAEAREQAASATLATIREERETEQREAREKTILELATAARENGLWAPGDPAETLFNKLAQIDVKLAQEHVESLQRSIPVGGPLQNRKPENQPALVTEIGRVLGEVYGATELQIQYADVTLRKMGVTPEMFAKHGPHVTEVKDPDEPWLRTGEEG
jgi:hypothetical protein